MTPTSTTCASGIFNVWDMHQCQCWAASAGKADPAGSDVPCSICTTPLHTKYGLRLISHGCSSKKTHAQFKSVGMCLLATRILLESAPEAALETALDTAPETPLDKVRQAMKQVGAAYHSNADLASDLMCMCALPMTYTTAFVSSSRCKMSISRATSLARTPGELLLGSCSTSHNEVTRAFIWGQED